MKYLVRFITLNQKTCSFWTDSKVEAICKFTDCDINWHSPVFLAEDGKVIREANMDRKEILLGKKQDSPENLPQTKATSPEVAKVKENNPTPVTTKPRFKWRVAYVLHDNGVINDIKSKEYDDVSDARNAFNVLKRKQMMCRIAHLDLTDTTAEWWVEQQYAQEGSFDKKVLSKSVLEHAVESDGVYNFFHTQELFQACEEHVTFSVQSGDPSTHEYSGSFKFNRKKYLFTVNHVNNTERLTAKWCKANKPCIIAEKILSD